MITTNYINMSAPTTTLTSTTATHAQTTLNLNSTTTNITSPTININSARFRFVPWTSVVLGSSISSIVGGTTTAPACSTSATVRYMYSVIGNTIYLNFLCYQSGTTGSSAGSGVYYFQMPPGYSYNLSLLVASSTASNGNNGTKVGNSNFKHFGTDNGLGGVYTLGAANTLVLWCETGPGFRTQDSGFYSYNTPNFYVAFEASLPIN